jgi:hypothetical protein
MPMASYANDAGGPPAADKRFKDRRSGERPVMADWDLWECNPNKVAAKFCGALLAQGRVPTETPMMFCCVPLRTAVFLNAVYSVVLAAFFLLSRQFIEDKLRMFCGGYALQSRVIAEILDVSALLWGSFGIVGCMFLKPGYIRVFHYYQYARLFAWFVMYYTDVPLLWHCEMWRTDTQEAAARFGWNDVMYRVSLSNRCPQERALFTTLSTICLLLFFYCIRGTQRFLEELEEEPKYLLRIPKDHPNGAFYTRSMASRTFVNKEKARNIGENSQVGTPFGVSPHLKKHKEPPHKPDTKTFVWDPFTASEQARMRAKSWNPKAKAKSKPKEYSGGKPPPSPTMQPPPWFGRPELGGDAGVPSVPPWEGGPPMSWSIPPWAGGSVAVDDPMPPPPPGSGRLWGLPERTRTSLAPFATMPQPPMPPGSMGPGMMPPPSMTMSGPMPPMPPGSMGPGMMPGSTIFQPAPGSPMPPVAMFPGQPGSLPVSPRGP